MLEDYGGGHLFRLEKARLTLLTRAAREREERLTARHNAVAQSHLGRSVGGAGGGGEQQQRHASAAPSPAAPEFDAEEGEEGDAFGIVNGFKNASHRLITSALFSKSIQKKSAPTPAVPPSSPPPPPLPLSTPGPRSEAKANLNNLSDKTAAARMKQAKSIGALVVVVEVGPYLTSTQNKPFRLHARSWNDFLNLLLHTRRACWLLKATC